MGTEKKTVKVNDQFSFFRSRYSWELVETYAATFKGEPVTSTRTTYHPSITSLAKSILDKSAGRCTDMQGIVSLFDNAVELLADEMTVVYGEVV